MYKRSLILIIILVIAVVLFAPFSHNVSLANSDNVDIIYPDINNYLYLDEPTFVAMKGDCVAVYDKGFNQIFTAGNQHQKYDVSLLDTDEYIASIAFANGTLYYLTNTSRLHDVFNNIDIDLDDEAILMYSYDDVLYLYNSLRVVNKYDGTFTRYNDKGRKILNSTAFASSNSFGYFYKESVIYKLDYANGTTEKIDFDFSVDKLMIINDELYASNTQTIFNVSNVSQIEIKDEVLDICTDGTYIATLNTMNKSVVKSNIDGDAVSMFGCASNMDYWFNNPIALKASSSNISIYDKNNHRVQIIGDNDVENISLSVNFDKFTANDNIIAMAIGSKLTIYYDDVSANIETGMNISAMALCNNDLFLYDTLTKTIYYTDTTSNNFDFKMFCYTTLDIKKMIAFGDESGYIIYALTNDGITSLTSIGRGQALLADDKILSFDVDYAGNVYTLSAENDSFYITRYNQSFNAYIKGDTTLLQNDELKNITDISLSNNGYIYAVDSTKNLLVRTNSISFNTKDNFIFDPVFDEKTIDYELEFAKTQTGTPVLKYSNNFNILTDVIDAGSLFTILKTYDGYYYILTENGALGYISSDNIYKYNTTKLSGQVVALFDKVGVYNIPCANADKSALVAEYDNKQVFTIINDCAGFNLGGDWVYVSYEFGGHTLYGYILKNRIMTYTAPVVSNETEKVTVKAKSSRVGEQVKGYAMQDTRSAELFSVADGTKLTLINDYDENSEYTFVEYNGIQAYVLTANIQIKKGLTSGQIAVITVSAIVFVITILYLLIVRRHKKIVNK